MWKSLKVPSLFVSDGWVPDLLMLLDWTSSRSAQCLATFY